jgi:hypothetical protein
MTNRELYLFVTNFEAKYSKEQCPPLEKYLSSLWAIAALFRQSEPTVEALTNWLDLAFIHPAPIFNSEWLKSKVDISAKGFDGWESKILSQIVDLRQMAESGQLEDEYRYFGIDAPRGSRWFNFDVPTYLECAVRGMYGGYAEEDVIVLYKPANGESADSEIIKIMDFSWEDFTELLVYGQIYE